jgi:hypothetical protein
MAAPDVLCIIPGPPSQSQLRYKVQQRQTADQRPMGTKRRDNTQYLVNTRVKKFKGSMPSRAKRAFFNEL